MFRVFLMFWASFFGAIGVAGVFFGRVRPVRCGFLHGRRGGCVLYVYKNRLFRQNLDGGTRIVTFFKFILVFGLGNVCLYIIDTILNCGKYLCSM